MQKKVPLVKIASFPNSLKYDIPASLVVFLVALPLCLGIALASGVPLFSGLIAGIVGGIVVGVLSKSPLSVSGPAAGLTAVVAAQISGLGTFEAFLFAMNCCISRAAKIVFFTESSFGTGKPPAAM